MKMNKFMRESLEKAGYLVTLRHKGVKVTKANLVILEVFFWYNGIIVRHRGQINKYDSINALWSFSGEICLKVRKGNIFLEITIDDGAG